MLSGSIDVVNSPVISQGNYYQPCYDADYEEKMLFRYRDGLREQIKTLQADDSPYKERAKEIEANLNTLILFTERQIYEKQLQKEKLKERKKEDSERLINPVEAAKKKERKNFVNLASLNRQLTVMERLTAAAKVSGDKSAKYDLLRRANEIAVEIKHSFY